MNHPVFGAYSFAGTDGIGEIGVSMTADRSSHEVSVDGSIFLMKIPGNHGTVSISCHQTSPLHKWLVKWFNYLTASDTTDLQWGRTTMLLKNTADATSHTISGISPLKIPDKSYQAQGQYVAWTLLAANIVHA